MCEKCIEIEGKSYRQEPLDSIFLWLLQARWYHKVEQGNNGMEQNTSLPSLKTMVRMTEKSKWSRTGEVSQEAINE